MFGEDEAAVAVTALPGQSLTDPIEECAAAVPRRRDAEPYKIRLGPGLKQHDDGDIKAYRLGRFCQQKGRRFWLLSRYDYYTPAVGDFVVGKVTVRTGEYYKVDINAGMHQAVLGAMAFDGATRKNRPSLNVGSVVYARVSFASPFMEPEIECVPADAGRNDEGFGEIKDGLVLRCSSSYSQRLQLSGHPLLGMLGKHFAFESIVGANGAVVVRSADEALTLDIVEAVRSAENYTEDQMKELVLRPLLAKHKRQQ